MSELFEPEGPDDHRLARTAGPGLLRDLNAAGVLSAADVQVARRVGDLAAGASGRTAEDEHALLALALCVRALRGGSVCLDLVGVRDVVEAADAATPQGPRLALPDHEAWCAAVDASALVAQGVLHRSGPLVHLDRYRREEEQVAADLLAREQAAPPPVDAAVLDAGLERVFPAATHAEQREAARHAVTRRTTVLTGGPGTGKTTAVAGLLVLLAGQAPAGAPLRVALAAPTGKAAARLGEAIAASAEAFAPPERAALDEVVRGVQATTLHRLLGWRPGSSTRFRHDRGNRLPHDVVVVDEASMLSLTMTARLLEAVRPQARLVLVGDADQLASVEAGAVLADLVAGFAGSDELDGDGGAGPVVRLRTSHRFGARIGRLAAALRLGDGAAAPVVPAAPVAPAAPADDVVAVTRALAAEGRGADGTAVELWETPADDPRPEATLDERLRPLLHPLARDIRAAALAGDSAGALRLLGRHRVLCAHRSGPHGVAAHNRRVEAWLAEDDPGVVPGGTYAGRPLIVVRNDRQLGLYNGDTGVVVRAADGSLRAVFATTEGVRDLAVSRVGEVETMHAMTIHKAQGSQADEVTVLLPDAASRLLTRELLYTAVTRAERVVRLVGAEASLAAAATRHVQRASGLRDRLRSARPDAARPDAARPDAARP
ncbi:exodeoxyribonuclease V subunit alpha [Nocardioides sp. ChNu-99]|uniref:exodeoxyribonuclease V subunit alpha n=1 Tax=Nocardioides sp. ChNu-99 TaxID=2839897 RepID=UPI0024065E81|nr:exodeoxyribonuclease V subunit alpha [Nocardioides sp. ChNu-99]MDF9714963.1 exodeoxyribonuclease V subunit alpha [Nocardioides sp. ChNu-99]